MSQERKIYFLSDFHLGAPTAAASLQREKKLVAFLQDIQSSAEEIFILGDIFDFWFEYKTVVPKGFTRLLGTIAAITDAGIPVHVFVGNHDMWMKDYFSNELGCKVYHEPVIMERQGKKLFIGHGDGLGPGDHGYKFIKKIFRNRFCQWAFGVLHPDWGIQLANYFSRKSRLKTGEADSIFLGEENEWLVQYSKEVLQQQQIDYFIFGHRHLPMDIELQEGSRYINLGDWIKHFTYATLDTGLLQLHYLNK
ncbi:MAG: UDP-2,3-diacylglucosamine diphosphatase [Sediminibacterium sp.]|nr:UDP-2,3-diacylglucosamine diphosphatase [Sediminibacterium sp.]